MDRARSMTWLQRRGSAIRWESPWVFFAQVYAATWIFFVPIAFSGLSFQNPWLLGAVGLSMVADEVIAVINAYRLGRGEAVRDFLVRIVDPRRISWGWYAVIFLSQPVTMGLGLLTYLAFGGPLPSLGNPAHLLASPLTFLSFLGFMLLYGPLPEEPGWRGYALDRLQTRYNALVSSLILGLVWGTWHLPLFFMEGSLQPERVGSQLVVSIGTLIHSVLFTWIYNNTNRSTLSAILFHFMIGFTGEFFGMPLTVKNYWLAWNAVLAFVVILIWGPQRLSHRPRRCASESKGTGRGPGAGAGAAVTTEAPGS